MRRSSVLLLSLALLFTAALPSAALAEPAAQDKAADAAAAAAAQRAPATQQKVTAGTSMESGSVASLDTTGFTLEFASGKLTRYARTATTRVRGYKTKWKDLALGDGVKVRLQGRNLLAVIVAPDSDAMSEIEAKRQKLTADYIKDQKAKAAKARANANAKPKKKQAQ